jgi:hypothetical protein
MEWNRNRPLGLILDDDDDDDEEEEEEEDDDNEKIKGSGLNGSKHYPNSISLNFLLNHVLIC